MPWSVLAAINKVESNFGQNMGPSSAGAIGWMQFMPDTWARWGVDANGDGIADPWNAEDAIYSAARYLAATGGATDIARAVFAYNHAQWYVDEVLQLAQQYAGGGVDVAAALAGAQQRARLGEAGGRGREREARSTRKRMRADLQAQRRRRCSRRAEPTQDAPADRLNAQKSASLADGRVHARRPMWTRARPSSQTAQDALQPRATGRGRRSFAPGAGVLLGAPDLLGRLRLPGRRRRRASSASGTPTTTIPAADIAAPEGSPALRALRRDRRSSRGRRPTGIAASASRSATTDGLDLDVLPPLLPRPRCRGRRGARRGPAGRARRASGEATGPHLHLQLQPATGYPAGRALVPVLRGHGIHVAGQRPDERGAEPRLCGRRRGAEPVQEPRHCLSEPRPGRLLHRNWGLSFRGFMPKELLR